MMNTVELIARFKQYKEDCEKNQKDILIMRTKLESLLEKINNDSKVAIDKLGVLPEDVQDKVYLLLGTNDTLEVTEENVKDVAVKWREVYAYLQDYCDKALRSANY